MDKAYFAFLDLGASFSFIDGTVAQKLREAGHRVVPEDRPLRMAKGETRISAKTSVLVYWRFGSV